jgi:uncharacterized membrane protein YgdD (TMEM256/DUF423 family)
MNWNRFFESGAAARVSAAWAGMAVALGAFGAHGLKPVLLQRPDGMETWRTAVLYHLVHAVVMMVLALQAKRANRAAWLLMFLGGLLLLAGWGCLVAKPWRISA